MHCFPAAFLLILLPILQVNIAVDAFDFHSISDDLAEFNITCEKDYCQNTGVDSLRSQNCHCYMYCIQLGTCCFNSYYDAIPQPKLKPVCRSVNVGDNYFVVDQCPSTDSVWANLCSSEWNGDDDVQKIVPVTSLFTSVTYKNYYCFRCHETGDDFLHWIVRIESESSPYNASEVKDKHVTLTYDNDTNTWMASYDEGVTSFDVKVSVTVPPEIEKITYVCEPNVISDCADDWTDEEVRGKCHSYMAIKSVRNNWSSSYKNIHCALCNYESLEDILCRYPYGTSLGKWAFSFTHLLDINRSDGELVGKIQKCSEDHLWDPYTRKCRKLTCALPGYTVKNGKCIQE